MSFSMTMAPSTITCCFSCQFYNTVEITSTNDKHFLKIGFLKISRPKIQKKWITQWILQIFHSRVEKTSGKSPWQAAPQPSLSPFWQRGDDHTRAVPYKTIPRPQVVLPEIRQPEPLWDAIREWHAPRHEDQKNMKSSLMNLYDKIMLRKRSVIETVNGKLKNVCQIEHTRHRSIDNFAANLFAGLIAYNLLPKNN